MTDFQETLYQFDHVLEQNDVIDDETDLDYPQHQQDSISEMLVTPSNQRTVKI